MWPRRPVGMPPVLITSAPPSPLEEFSNRRRQYALVKSIRIPCFILAVVGTLTWLRIVLIVGALVLPWVAVVAANQAKSRKAGGPALYVAVPRRALTDGEEPGSRHVDRRT